MSYLPKLFSTGAIRKTPDRIIEKMASEVETLPPGATIIEAGAGMGEITEAVLRLADGKSLPDYYAYEIDPESCAHLKSRFPNIRVLQDSIFDFEKHLPPGASLDYFISSIPFSFYKNDLISAFLENVKLRLNDNGKVILLFTAAWLMPVFKKAFPHSQTEAFLTFPPYFLIVYRHRKT